jgi:urease accessory protein
LRTELRITAKAGTSPTSHATGGLAARLTAPDTVHLIGTAATPLGGDHLDITITVAPGARLLLRSVAATIALPGSSTVRSTAHWRIDVGEDAELDFDPEPLIVAGAAEHHTITTLRLAPTARVRLRERVQIGRCDEDAGHWRGDLTADITHLALPDSERQPQSTVPLLRHRLELGPDTIADDLLGRPRALISELTYPDARMTVTEGTEGAVLPLAAGGTLYTRVSARL